MALGPVQAFTGTDTKLRWTDLYASDSINKVFLGMPRGIYLGFTPIVTGQTLTLQRDTAIVFESLIGTFTVGDTVVGGASGATAIIRLVQTNLPGLGVINVDTVTGVFADGETLSAPGATATLNQITTDDTSIAKLSTTSTYAGGRTEEAITIILGADVVLDFAPGTITNGTYFVMVTASYEIGLESTAQVISRKFDPPDGRLEIGVCSVTKFGATLLLDPITTINRTNPYADDTTRVGFMPPGSISFLSSALQTVQEVTAA